MDGRAAPDANDEYLFYQTLVGAWPARDEDESLATLTERLVAYMEKATKEAKRHTSWVNPSAGYDAATRGFVTGLLAPGGAFLSAFRPFQQLVAAHGAVNSLAQTLLKIAAPGDPRLLPGHRALGALARGSRQPPAGRLRPPAGAAATRSAPASPTRTRAPRT